MTCKINHSGDGETVSFSFPFFIPAKTALEVRVGGAIRAEGFNIVGAACPEGGKVVFDAPPALGEQVSLRYRGGVSATVDDATFGHLADKLVGGANVTVTTETLDGGVQRLRIDGAANTFDQDTADGLYLAKSANLSDVINKDAARANLGVTAAISAVETSLNNAVSTLNGSIATVSSGAVMKAENLSDVPNKDVARANLGVTAAISAVETSLNNAVSTLNGSIATVSSGAVMKAENLSDVPNKDVARANLGVTAAISAVETSLNNAVSTLNGSITTVSNSAVMKANNLSDVNASLARTNLGLDGVAYRTIAQDWLKPQRSQAVQAANVGGSVVLDFAQYQNFDLSLTAAITFANPTVTADMVGQKGTIGIVPNGHAIAGMGSQWKRVGETGSPSDIIGNGRIDYHIRALDRIEYAYNDVEV